MYTRFHRHLGAVAVGTAIIVAGCTSPLPFEPVGTVLPPVQSHRDGTLADPAALNRPLDAEVLVGLALRNDPALLLLRQDAEVAKANRLAAFDIRDPELGIEYSQGDGTSTRREAVPATLAPWIEPVPYRLDFTADMGWERTEIPGNWRAPGVRPMWAWNESAQAWENLKGDADWRTTDSTTGWYVDTIQDTFIRPEELSGNYIATVDEDVSQQSYQVDLTFYPPNPFAMRHKISAADAKVLAARERVKSAEWKLTSDVLKAYEKVQYYDRELASLSELIAMSAEIEKILETRVAAGAATLQDAMRASILHMRFIAERDNIEDLRIAEVRALASYAGLPESELRISTVKTTLPAPDIASFDAVQFRASAMKHRPDLAAAAWDVHAAVESEAEADAENLPWFASVQAHVARGDSDSLMAQRTTWLLPDGSSVPIYDPRSRSQVSDSTEWGIGAAIVIPVFGHLLDRTAPFRAEVQRGRTIHLSAARAVEAETVAACANLADAARSLSEYREESAPRLAKMRTLLAGDAAAGLPPDQVLSMKIDVIGVERTEAKVSYAYRSAILDLTRALGCSIAEAVRSKQSSLTGVHYQDDEIAEPLPVPSAEHPAPASVDDALLNGMHEEETTSAPAATEEPSDEEQLRSLLKSGSRPGKNR